MACHDDEWGVPVYDDTKLFEYLTLESAQAGLSWYTIFKRRNGYREAFAQFDVNKVAEFEEKNRRAYVKQCNHKKPCKNKSCSK